MTLRHGISNVAYLFRSGKAIRSDGPRNTVWFFRIDKDYVALLNGDRHVVSRDTIERNIDHKQTDVETVPVEDSPFQIEH